MSLDEYRKILVGLTLLILWISTSVLAYEVVDATQTRVTITKAPQRVITLAPSLGELAVEILGGKSDRIVGVTEYSDYPAELKKKASVGPYHRFNIEKVVSLKPDLVLATSDGNTKNQIEHLRELKVPLVVVRTEDFDQVANSMLLVAKALSLDAKGEELASQFKKGILDFQNRAKGRTPVSVLLQVGDHPLVVAGGKSFLSAALQVLGARNAYSETGLAYPRPAVEDVIHRNPDVMIVLALGADVKYFEPTMQNWKRFPRLKAVKNQHIHMIQNDALVRPTLRLLEGLKVLENTIYDKK